MEHIEEIKILIRENNLEDSYFTDSEIRFYFKKNNQDIEATAYELLLINDGSTDKSGEICDLYKKRDRRIKVIHKENGGLSDARNKGIEIASGEYIAFLDADDEFLDETALEKMYAYGCPSQKNK